MRRHLQDKHNLAHEKLLKASQTQIKFDLGSNLSGRILVAWDGNQTRKNGKKRIEEQSHSPKTRNGSCRSNKCSESLTRLSNLD